MTAPSLTAAALAAALRTTDAPVLLDIRDPVEADRGHVPGATTLPRRRLEFRIGSLVQDRSTPIVVYGSADPRAGHAAATLSRLGYGNVRWLEGGLDGWCAAGGAVATGNNVPSKIFGERVQHGQHVPSVGADTLRRWQREGLRLAICDVRTPEEHRDACIPGAVSAPSFDVALVAADLAEDHDTIVLHCAGRTRSIIGTQTLVEMGIARVVALENGTMGWRLAGHALDRGSERKARAPSPSSMDQAEERAAVLAEAARVHKVSAEALERLLADTGRNRYVFDVRSVSEYRSGHVPGSLALPGGQAVQRADDFIAVRGAPIVLVDRREARANLTATWLRRMGFPDVSVLAGGLDAWTASGRPVATGRERDPPLGWQEAVADTLALSATQSRRWLQANPDALVLDVDGSAHFRHGHLPGARWLPRSRLESAIAEIVGAAPDAKVLVTCADGSQSAFAAATLRALGHRDVRRLDGGTRAWAAAGHALAAADLEPQDDELLPAYERGEQAMRDYIDWEKLLVSSTPADRITGRDDASARLA